MDKMKADKKIIVLISPPRSLSTAFLRMMAARKDFTIINEPSCCVFNHIHYPYSQMFYSEQVSISYSEVKKKILSSVEDRHVFVKEMSYSFEEFISFEPDLIKKTNIIFVFLLRDPHHCIISFYKKIPHQFLDYIMIDLDKLISYQSLYSVFKIIKNEAIYEPYVMHATQLYNDTTNAIQDFCRYIKVPYQNEFLHWQTLGEQFTGLTEWQENKKKAFTHHWHQEAIYSHGFHQPTTYEVDVNGNPTFSEINNESHRTRCVEIYQQTKTFYQLLNLELGRPV